MGRNIGLNRQLLGQNVLLSDFVVVLVVIHIVCFDGVVKDITLVKGFLANNT